jgi:hypothetical protein
MPNRGTRPRFQPCTSLDTTTADSHTVGPRTACGADRGSPRCSRSGSFPDDKHRTVRGPDPRAERT